MARNLSSDININFKSNASKMAGDMTDLVKRFQELSSGGDAFGASLALLNKVLTEFEGKLNTCIDTCVEITSIFGDMASDGVDFVAESFDYLRGVLDDTIAEVQRLSEIGADIQDGYFALFNYMGKEAGNDIKNFTSELERLYSLDADKTVMNLRSIMGVVSNMGLGAEETTNAVKELTMFAYDLGAYSGLSFEDIAEKFERTFNYGRLIQGDAITNALDMNDEFIYQFRELETVEERIQAILSRGEKVRGSYERWLETSAGKIEQLNNRLGILEGSLSKLITGVYAKIAPLVSDVVNTVNSAVMALSSVLNIDITSAEDNQAVSYLKDMADAIEEVGKSAEKASKKRRPFDELIQVDKGNTSNGLGDIDFSTSNVLSDVQNVRSEFEIIIDKVRELLELGDYKAAGDLFSDGIVGWLEDIDWEDLQNKISKTGEIIGKFFNGITIDNSLAVNVGYTFAEIINSAISGLGSLGSTLDFNKLGTNIGSAWNGFWMGLNTDDLANTAMEWFTGLFESISGFVGTEAFSETGGTLADLINVFFFGDGTEENLGLTSERMDEIANGIIGFIDGVFAGVDTLLTETNIEGIKEKLKELLTKLFTSFAENSGDWGSTLNKLFTTIFDTATELLHTADKNGLKKGINDFLSGLDLASILTSYLRFEFEKWKITARTETRIFFSTLGNWIWDAIEELWVIIKTLIALHIITIKTMFVDLPVWFLDKVNEIGTNIMNSISQWFGDIITGVKEWVKNIKDEIAKISGISDIKANISTKWETSGWNPSNWDVPWLGNGGVAYSTTPAVIGDSGIEVVLPLSQNTGWAKHVADLINVNLANGNNNSGGTTYLDMSGISKQFYTRSELLSFGELIVESLKLQGINIASLI